MYQNACGAAAASAGGCVGSERDCHSLISKEPAVPAIEHDYSGFDIVKATQVSKNTQTAKYVATSNELCSMGPSRGLRSWSMQDMMSTNETLRR